MNVKELRKLSEKELLKRKKELEETVMSSYSKVRPKIKPEQRRGAKRIIAQINIILYIILLERDLNS